MRSAMRCVPMQVHAKRRSKGEPVEISRKKRRRGGEGVHEEKEKLWESDIRALRSMYDTRLRTAQQRAIRAEQTYLAQNNQVGMKQWLIPATVEPPVVDSIRMGASTSKQALL
ncbi:unnamed protein product [Cyprideis torosa]|uniref:Uncharacterized protein n=1 Tax=Cyprideis torosa TaxID=163714 RepID=A0A7R8W7N7_9CRUS|nr:unnamed protein product [Cyprideis torosa]CAG0882619.1 unnamed protein product [Cyprideis torosa]